MPAAGGSWSTSSMPQTNPNSHSENSPNYPMDLNHQQKKNRHLAMEVSWNGGTPKSSIFVWDFPW